MSRASNFQQNQSRGVGRSLTMGLPRERRPSRASAAEIEWVLAKHAERPDLSAYELARLVFRQFGVDRSASSIRKWLLKNAPAPKENTL
ncbi:helix-turn-helix domain-containing protein [Microbacterium sp. T32]|uniref:helix-turn-helix domain-containing protein n=1 Tax=Microbacterium sp. T32 TaxID=1776083 RepID=UPI0007ABC393|nr:helix-turn-helix domain-containing protein [Microbacterium sp. T32]KZE41374.1 hypothetical protein AVW09_01960 [Microbacterium sp. T32]